jgi:hypothetical protein
MGEPIRGGQTGTQNSLNAAVNPFDHPVGLRVESSGGHRGDVEEGTKMGPKGGRKLRAPVGGEMSRDPETGDPVKTESRSTIRRRGRRERGDFHPAGGAVHHGKKMGIALRGGKGTDNIDMNMGETAGGNGDGHRRGGDMTMNFGFLAGHALAGP